MSSNVKINEKLFPIPQLQSKTNPGQNHLAPNRWPGITVESTNTLRELLTENWEKHHIFVNKYGFHNHIVHAITTQWALGSPPAIIRASYKEGAEYQLPLITPPNAITNENWRDHVGDEKYYKAYREFFFKEIQKKSAATVVEEYVFAPEANFVDGVEKQPEMVSRSLEALMHSMIHIGFGIEFGVPGILAEGLAQAAVHKVASTPVIHKGLFDGSSSLSDHLSRSAKISESSNNNVHALTIFARVLNDPELIYDNPSHLVFFYPEVVARHGDKIKRHVEAWTLEGQDLKKKLEELIWLNTLMYVLAGVSRKSDPNEPFIADFFLMHLVTSSLFVPTVFSVLSPPAQIIFLKSYLSVSLGWYIGVGRPQVDVRAFFSNPSSTHPTIPGPHPTPHSTAIINKSDHPHEAITPNPWFALLQSTLVHPDDHLVKFQRALATWDGHFGEVQKGAFGGGVTELEGAEEIDGSLFVRAAVLTMERMGWVREGMPSHGSIHRGLWDRAGFHGDGRPAPRLQM